MILDAYGHQYARSIGFGGGLREVPRRRREKDTADAIAWASVELEETYEPIEECRNLAPDRNLADRLKGSQLGKP